jgi:hypothetical protein
MDRDRLAKLLSLTQSDNDHEALSAVRSANAMFKKNSLTWSQVLGGQVSSVRGRSTGKANVDDYSDIMRWWEQEMTDTINRAHDEQVKKSNANRQQQTNSVTEKVKVMIEACKAKYNTTRRMDEIYEKVKRGGIPTSAEEQYVKAVYDVVGRT